MEKEREKKPGSGFSKKIAGRVFSALILFSVAAVLILWDRGVLSLPFLPERTRSEEQNPSPAENEIEVLDIAAYRADLLKAIYAFSNVDDGYLHITPDRFDYAKMTLALSPLDDRAFSVGGLPRYVSAGGFLQILNENGAVYTIPAEEITVTDSASALPLFDRTAEGKIVFQTPDGENLVWNYDASALVPSDWDRNESLGYSFYVPADWIDPSPVLAVIRDPATSLYGYARRVKTASGETELQIAVEPQYVKAYPYHEGVAVMIDSSGREYLRGEDGELLFPDRIFWASDAEGEDATGFYSMQNSLIRVIESTHTPQGEEVVREVLLFKNGSEFTLPSGFSCTGFSEGVFRVTNGESVGYYSLNQTWVADPVYAYGGVFTEGIAVVQNASGLYGAIDLQGREQVPCAFSYLSPMAGGLLTLYSPEQGWYLLYKTAFVPGDRSVNDPPVTTVRPYVTRIPISRNSDPLHGDEDDEPYIFSSVAPAKRTTVPEWTLTPRPDFSTSKKPPDPTEPGSSSTDTPDRGGGETPAPLPPDPIEAIRGAES